MRQGINYSSISAPPDPGDSELICRMSQRGLLAAWGAAEISAGEGAATESSQGKANPWAAGWPQTTARFSLQMVSLSQKCGWHCWQELKALQYCNCKQQK